MRNLTPHGSEKGGLQCSPVKHTEHLYIFHLVPHFNEQPAQVQKSERNLVKKIEKFNMIESANTYLVALPQSSRERNLGESMRNLTPYGSKRGGFRRSPITHTHIYSTQCLVLMSYASICCKYQWSFDHHPSLLPLVEIFCHVFRKLHLVPCHRRIGYVLLSCTYV